MTVRPHGPCALVAGGFAAIVLFGALLVPPTAGAHAVLDASAPGRGEQVRRSPQQVALRFNEPVEVAFGSVRVYDASGARVDSGPTRHPGGRGEEVAVALRSGVGDGIYTATYRVVSADSHPVAGGFTFTVGAGGGAPAATVDDLIDAGAAGPVTEVAFGAVRALAYTAIALAVGGFVFVAGVWRPAMQAVAGAGTAWREASKSFAGRARRLGLAAAGIGIASSALGIVLQGATAGATSFWSALDPAIVRDVFDTRFGGVWGLRLLAWALFGALVALSAAGVRAPELRPASLGATGLALGGATRPLAPAAAAALLGFLCLTPALAGHASTLEPSALLVPANALHVTAMAVWVGGIAMLLLALPVATRRLEPADRSRLLAAAVARFSTVALIAVAALVAGGIAQAIPALDSLSDFVDTAFGRALLAKIVLFLALIALGAWNRQRIRPRLAALAADGASPGRTGRLLRRTLGAEAALMLTVLGMTAALVAYAPPSGLTGPFSESEQLGPARMELTVDPARPGRNEVHLYLFRRSDGSQWNRVKELRLRASLPEKDIGPLDLRAEKAGPGHYVVHRADITPGGEWTVEISVRVSEFDQYVRRVQVPVE